jgi:hypothetical protein
MTHRERIVETLDGDTFVVVDVTVFADGNENSEDAEAQSRVIRGQPIPTKERITRIKIERI